MTKFTADGFGLGEELSVETFTDISAGESSWGDWLHFNANGKESARISLDDAESFLAWLTHEVEAAKARRREQG